jgi:D-hydroxyproline dehydrogenase subunit beta
VSRLGAVDVAVIGGGIVGTATAAFLAAEGLRVRLHERSEIAAGASGRNSGIVQHPFDAVLADLYHRTLVEYRSLETQLGLRNGGDSGFRLDTEPAGLLYVGHDDVVPRETARRWAETWPGAKPEVLAGRDLRRLEPSLSEELVACRLQIGFPVAPAAATHAFAELATAGGVEIVVGAAATLAIAGDRVVGVDVGGETAPAGAVVVAAGPWTPEVIDPTGRWQPIRSSWGVVASVAVADAPRHGIEATDIDIEPPQPSTVREPVGNAPAVGAGNREDVASAVAPPPDPSDAEVDFSLAPGAGSSALGSTFLRDEPDPAAWLDALRRVGARYVPAIASAPILGFRHCARPVSVDGRPLVGRAPGVDGLWLIAGHGPWGISTAPGSARLLVEAFAAGRGEAAIPAALDPGRFGAPGRDRRPAVDEDQRQASPLER